MWQESADFGIRGNVYWGSSNTPVASHGINGTKYFEQQDWTGTERIRTSYTGAVVATDFSYAFGDGYSVSGNDEDQYHFAGTDRDNESGTDHAQFRQYSETLGRWMSPDPYDGSYDSTNPQSFNRHSYVMNNPLGFWDALGLEREDDDAPESSDSFGASFSYSCPDTPNFCISVNAYGAPLNDFTSGGVSGGKVMLQMVQSYSFRQSAPNNVGCNTVLPNGNTLGQYINQGRAQMQASVNAGGAFNGEVLTTFASIAKDYGQIDFKNGAAGSSVLENRAELGQAGNFAYYAIGSGYLSPGLLDSGAGAYAVTSALLGRKPFSSLTGPMFSDASAASVRNAGLATQGCPQ